MSAWSSDVCSSDLNGAVLPYLGQFADDTAVICERPAMDDVDHLVQPHGILGWAHIPAEGDERVGDRKRGVHGLILRLGDQFIEKRGSLSAWRAAKRWEGKACVSSGRCGGAA